MRKFGTVLLILLAALATTASAQWLETRVLLPESLLALKSPQVLLCDPAHNAVYIGGESGVVVLDATSGETRARLPAPGQVTALCLNPEREKLYYACASEGTVRVADCITMRVLSQLPLSARVDRMVYSPATDRIFAAASDGRAIPVIDCARDSLAGSLTGFLNINDICVNPAGTKLYCADEGLERVYVLDCAAGILLDSVWTGDGPFTLLYNHLADKVYCSNHYDEDVAVIDAVSDSLIRFVPLDGPTSNLALNPLLNLVYCVNGTHQIGVISGTGDSVLAQAYCEGNPSFMAFDSVANVLCAAARDQDRVVLVDGTDSSLLGILPTGDRPVAIAYNPGAGQVQIANYYSATLTSIDCSAREIADTKALAMTPDQLIWTGNADRVYAADAEIGRVAVIDGATNEIAGLIELDSAAQLVVPAPAEGKVYYATRYPSIDSTSISVVIQPSESVTRVVRVPGQVRRMAYTSDRLLYCSSVGNYIYWLLRIDCRNDSLDRVTLIPWTDGGMAYAEGSDRLFVVGDHSLQVFRADSGTSLPDISMDWMPGGLYSIPGLNQIVACSPESSAIAFIDAGTCSLSALVPVGHDPSTMCYNARHDWLYCSVDGPQLVVVDVTSRLPVTTRPIAAYGPAMVLDTFADRLYLQGYSKLQVIDCSGNQRILWELPTGYSNGLAWNPVNRRVYVPDGDKSAVFVIRDSAMTGIAERGENVTTQFWLPTMVRGILLLPAASGLRSAKGVSLLDISGRKVLELSPGANDVSRLAPGVYFVRSQSGPRRETVRRIVIAR